MLRPGGRVGVSDIVAEDQLSPKERAERGSYVGCIAGALSVSEYIDGLQAVGFTDVSVAPTHSVAAGMHSAIVKASMPVDAVPIDALPVVAPRTELDMVSTGCCGDTGCC